MFDQGSSLQGRLLPFERLCRNVPPDIWNNPEGLDLGLGSPWPTIHETTIKPFPCTSALRETLIVAWYVQSAPNEREGLTCLKELIASLLDSLGEHLLVSQTNWERGPLDS